MPIVVNNPELENNPIIVQEPNNVVIPFIEPDDRQVIRQVLVTDVYKELIEYGLNPSDIYEYI